MATILAAANGNFSTGSTWTGGVVPGTGDIAVANGKTITVTGTVQCQEFQVLSTSTVAGGQFVLSNGCEMIGTGSSATPVGGFRCTNANTAAFVYSGLSGNSARMTGTLQNDAANNQGAISNLSTGTLNIVGDINGANAATSSNTYGVRNASSGTVNITGAVAIATGATSATVNAVRNEQGGTVNINLTGTLTGGIGQAGSAQNTVNNVGAGFIYITGNVTGGSGASANGVINSAAGTVSVSGSCTGGTGSVGLSNAGTVTSIGAAVGGPGAAGVSNSGTISACTTVKGNAFGVGATVTAQYGLVNTGVAYVSNIEYGDLGMSPVSGAVWLTDVASNQSIMYRVGLSKKTLVDAAATASYVPAVSDVRLGTSYNSGNNTGTCAIPAAGSVALGVAVDATTGTAALTPAAVWAYLTASATTSGSMGERLKNAGTVATIGQQIADSLV